MIISASRRTDIPAFFSEWFFNRLNKGFAMVRNPMYPRQISKVPLTPDVVDGIVFWTKNPAPMMKRLNELGEYSYYFQFTVTPYNSLVEKNVPDKVKKIIPIFKKLSDTIGPERVIWRYDPILSIEPGDEKVFAEMARELRGYTEKIIISFVETKYKEIQRNMDILQVREYKMKEKLAFCEKLSEIADENGLIIEACASDMDVEKHGVGRARCVDTELLARISGDKMYCLKATSQRPYCECHQSVDIGAYNTCKHDCLYCYANYDQKELAKNREKHDPKSPLIRGWVSEWDKVTDRKVVMMRKEKICGQSQLAIPV